MKTAFLKFLPIAAAVLLATSCSKDDNDNAPATESGSNGVETVTANTIPFSIHVNTGHSLKKMAYENGTEVGSYQPKFEQSDEGNLTMIIKDGDNVIGNLTLDDAKTATFSGSLTQQPSSNASLTAEISVSGSKNSSNESLADLLANCAHNFIGEFKFGDKTVDLTDQNAYLAISMSPCCDHEIKINSDDYTVKDGRIWISVPASANVTSTGLGEEISKSATEVAPGTIYTVARQYFSVSPTKKVYFSKGNLQYDPTQDKWQFAAHQYDICHAKGDNVGDDYANWTGKWIDLFGWGMWLDKSTLTVSGYKDNINPLKTSTTSTDYLSYDDNGSKVVYKDDLNALGRSAMGSEWTLLTCGDGFNSGEWNYLFGLNLSALDNRDNAENLKHWTTVNYVYGLVILPDGYDYTSIDWSNYDWADLEKAGAVFLPASGRRNGTVVYDIGDYGNYWSSSYYDYDENEAFYLFFVYGSVGWGHDYGRCNGLSVRLVRAL